MDRQIHKLNELAEEYMGKTPMQVRGKMGIPDNGSENEKWEYYSGNQFSGERITLVFRNNTVTDIEHHHYFLGIKITGKSYLKNLKNLENQRN